MKLSMFLTAAALATAISSGHIFAQDTKNQAEPVDRRTARMQKAPGDLSDAPSASAAAVSTINLKAIRDFKTRFANVKDEQWFTMDNGFISYFWSSGCRVRAYYDRKGHWLASLIYGDEHKLPPTIRDVVRRAYYDLPITFVEVVEAPQGTAYLVHVQDNAILKVLRVSEEGEIEVLGDYTKS